MERKSPDGGLRPFAFERLLDLIPEIQLIPAQIDFKSFEKPLDSSDMQPEHWVKLADIIHQNYSEYNGFVVLHGTDTMAFTASALSFMFDGLQKPIIFTGSQLPIGDLRTDAKENLITSLEFASLRDGAQSAIKEVCIYFEYKLYRANRTTKVSAAHFNAFESPNYPDLGESGVKLMLHRQWLWSSPATHYSYIPKLSRKVALIKLFSGMSAHGFCSINYADCEVVVLEAFGSGNIFNDKVFSDYLRNLRDKGIALVVITQCVRGMVNLGLYSSSRFLVDIGAITGGDLTTEAAITKTMALLGRGISGDEFRKEFTKNFSGEQSI